MRAILMMLITAGIAAQAEDPSGTRLTFKVDSEGTRFSYDIPLNTRTLRKVDDAIFRGSYLGLLEASRVKTESTPEERASDRIREIEVIAARMKAGIAPPKVVPDEVKAVDKLDGPAPSSGPDVTAGALPRFQGPDAEMAALEDAWARGSFESAFHRMGSLSAFLPSLGLNPPAEAIAVVERWRKFREAHVEDGLLRLPSTGGKRLMTLRLEKAALPGRVLRHLMNLALVRGIAAESELYGLLLFLDEYSGDGVVKLQGPVQSAILSTGDLIALRDLVKERLLTEPLFQKLRETVLLAHPELRPQVIEGLAQVLIEKRRMAWSGYGTVLVPLMTGFIE